MNTLLAGRQIALLATDGFEQVELTEPRRALEEAGAKTEVLSIKPDKIKGWNHTDWGTTVRVDRLVKDAKPEDYDALVLPGGQMNPDSLRLDTGAIAFIREFARTGRPIAAICHGPWTLIDAGAAKGKKMTSWPSLQIDLKNAGANWVDQEVVQDGNLITSRKPEDLPAFNHALIEMLARAPGRRETAVTAA
jgi:protease I